MAGSVHRQLEQRRQYTTYFVLSLLSLMFAVILNFLPGTYFQPFFGNMNPLFVIVMASGLGLVALWILRSSYGFVIIEPTFQVLFQGRDFMWGDIYTWIHVLVISALQLYIFWRFDFVSMYVFRLFYYFYWHILWGVIRLDVLF